MAKFVALHFVSELLVDLDFLFFISAPVWVCTLHLNAFNCLFVMIKSVRILAYKFGMYFRLQSSRNQRDSRRVT